MKHIALIGDTEALRQFLSKLKKYQVSAFPALCFKIGSENIRVTVPNYLAKVEHNAAAVIWFLSEKDKKINQQCVEIIKHLPKEVHLDSYFLPTGEEEPHLFLNSLLQVLPQIEYKRMASYNKSTSPHFNLDTFYKWSSSFFMPEKNVTKEKIQDVEAEIKFNRL